MDLHWLRAAVIVHVRHTVRSAVPLHVMFLDAERGGLTDRVRITVDGELLHEGPRSWSSPGRDPPPPEPTEYDRLPPYGAVLDFAGFRRDTAYPTLDEMIANVLGFADIKAYVYGLHKRDVV